MERTDGTYRPGVSIHEAAVMLGVSPTTVRRWVASGRLRSQRFDRPQGEVVRVILGPEQLHVPPAAPEQVSAAQIPVDAPPPTAAARTDVSPAEQMATLAAAILMPVLAPLVAEMAAVRQAGERKDNTIRDQAETIGRQKAELERAASTVVALNRELERLQPSPEAPGSSGGPASTTEPSTFPEPFRSRPAHEDMLRRLWARWWWGIAAAVVLVAVVVWWMLPR
jgi:excisionase family DNA binding protein